MCFRAWDQFKQLREALTIDKYSRHTEMHSSTYVHVHVYLYTHAVRIYDSIILCYDCDARIKPKSIPTCVP